MKDLLLVCLEDWQGAYIDGELVADGVEVNLIPIINEYKCFNKAEYVYLYFETDQSFERFLAIRGGEMPYNLIDLEDWL